MPVCSIIHARSLDCRLVQNSGASDLRFIRMLCPLQMQAFTHLQTTIRAAMAPSPGCCRLRGVGLGVAAATVHQHSLRKRLEARTAQLHQPSLMRWVLAPKVAHCRAAQVYCPRYPVWSPYFFACKVPHTAWPVSQVHVSARRYAPLTRSGCCRGHEGCGGWQEEACLHNLQVGWPRRPRTCHGPLLFQFCDSWSRRQVLPMQCS